MLFFYARHSQSAFVQNNLPLVNYFVQKADFKIGEKVERRGTASLHSVQMEYTGKGDRAMTLAYDIPLPEGPVTVFPAPDKSRTLNHWDAPVTVDTRPGGHSGVCGDS